MSVDRPHERRFQLVLIKPSHYDDDGYVIRWWRGMIPSNSLAAVYGIATDCAEREVLGPGVAIDIDAIDETTTRVDTEKLLARLAIRHGRNPAAYMDQALMPVGDDNDETGDLLTRTTDARAAVAHARRVAVLTGSNS